MDVQEAITIVLASLGAVLGVINTVQGLSKDRVRLKVMPSHAIPFGGADPRLRFAIEITNLSAFAVTIADVGVFYRDTDARGSVISPIVGDGGPWPRRLEPRSSVSIYSELPASKPGHPIKSAYARTQCGYTKTGSSPALRQIARGQAPG